MDEKFSELLVDICDAFMELRIFLRERRAEQIEEQRMRKIEERKKIDDIERYVSHYSPNLPPNYIVPHVEIKEEKPRPFVFKNIYDHPESLPPHEQDELEHQHYHAPPLHDCLMNALSVDKLCELPKQNNWEGFTSVVATHADETIHDYNLKDQIEQVKLIAPDYTNKLKTKVY